ncbi:MAG: molybdate ABC transporter permease subunit, partial [Rhodoglobus sp.]
MRRSFLTPALWIPAGIAIGLLGLPLVALVVRAPWVQLPELLSRGEVLQALGLSLSTAAVSTAVSLVLGIPLALVLARSAEWPTVPRRLLRALVTVPLVLPPVVGGVALLLLLGRRG